MISGYELLLVALSIITTLVWQKAQTRKQLIALQKEIQERLQAEAQLQLQKLELEQALSNLKQVQTKLIQNEKMLGLEQLVAGIAHGINNPLNFISGNLKYTNQYIQDLLKLIQVYHEKYPDSISIAKEIIQDADFDFVSKDLQNSISAMERGVERIQQLVLSLRNFSRLDEAEIKRVDIHQGIESTLMILLPRLKETMSRPEIVVLKEYGKLPLVTCYPSQLNQVFMHLLNNAIDALERQDSRENFSQPNPQIRISTELTDVDTVRILIADNGCGISDLVRERLFDPFFTTKPVGRTGLGLSISYQIVVQEHKGKLTYCSSPELGSEFAIEIPVHCAKVEQLPVVLSIGL
ncbi:sensor histidine kinase [Iningainema tapete]|uniref:histidine kinase n=1 Tax=Iningainema tapete BLCC-T55 TaxID=2748662 RepID=A0A8J6XQM1_9CYAN|nr:ATP-binding protein [Iningainema tapete]MBD2777762.1 hypothetical protein [Iningainema tapete BLCC-T55]